MMPWPATPSLLHCQGPSCRLTYPLVLLSPMAHNTLEFAKSQLEWMNDTLIKELELSRDRDNPFSVRYETCFKHCMKRLPDPAGRERPVLQGQHVHSTVQTCLWDVRPLLSEPLGRVTAADQIQQG